MFYKNYLTAAHHVAAPHSYFPNAPRLFSALMSRSMTNVTHFSYFTKSPLALVNINYNYAFTFTILIFTSYRTLHFLARLGGRLVCLQNL